MSGTSQSGNCNKGVPGCSTLVSEQSCCGTPLPCPIQAFRDDAEAKVGGLVAGDIYQTSDTNTLGLPAGVLMVVQNG